MIIEFFCGAGGVGKTTLSSTRAMSLAKDKKVLLMTIDPSLRLKDILKIKVSGELVEQKYGGEGTLYAMLLNTEEAMSKILKTINVELKDQRILSLLARPFGGLNEILAMVELGRLLKDHEFDVVVIDTPPGGHFLEFLDGLERINNFFDESFVQVLNLVNEKTPNSLFKSGLWLKALMQTGIDKLLDYLGKVTGQGFVQEFINAIKTVYLVKDKFIHASQTLDEQAKKGNVHFYIVTHAEHEKALELQNLRNSLTVFSQAKTFALVNYEATHEWSHDIATLPDGPWKTYTQRLKTKNANLKTTLYNFNDIFEFPKVQTNDVQSAIEQLTQYWKTIKAQ